jgi:hypothetical protein
MGFDVFGMCNALVDLQAQADEALLMRLGLEKGGMFLIDEARRQETAANIYRGVSSIRRRVVRARTP